MQQSLESPQQAIGPYEGFEGFSGVSTNEESVIESQSERDLRDVATESDVEQLREDQGIPKLVVALG